MRLLDGVQTYVDGKRIGGAIYAEGIKSLSAFCRYAGDVELSSIRERQVASFLDGPHTSPVTWRQKYNVLRHFFLFWVARNAVPVLPMPPPRPPVVTTFVPYIYSRTEIRLLLSTVRSSQEKSGCKIDARTLRTFLLFLYGTGALVGEARRLLREDVDLKRRTITLRSNRFNRLREIPIGPDLYKVLRRYHTTNHRMGDMNAPQFFLTKEGYPLKERAACQTFQRLRRMAGIARDDGARYQPRLHDLRHTFAVHRLTAWIKRGADLNRMIPALSAYIRTSWPRLNGSLPVSNPRAFPYSTRQIEPAPRKATMAEQSSAHEVLVGTVNQYGVDTHYVGNFRSEVGVSQY